MLTEAVEKGHGMLMLTAKIKHKIGGREGNPKNISRLLKLTKGKHIKKHLFVGVKNH